MVERKCCGRGLTLKEMGVKGLKTLPAPAAPPKASGGEKEGQKRRLNLNEIGPV